MIKIRRTEHCGWDEHWSVFGNQSFYVVLAVLYAPCIIPLLGAYQVDDATWLPDSLNSTALHPVQNIVAPNITHALQTSAFDHASPVTMAALVFPQSRDATDSPEMSHDFDHGHVPQQQRRLLQETSQLPVKPTRRSEMSAGNFSNNDDVVTDDIADGTTSAANKTAGKRKYDGVPRRWFHVVNGAQSGGIDGAPGSGTWSGSSLQRPKDSYTVNTRLIYGAIALVLASLLTPMVFLLIGLARNRIKKCLERRRRYDKSGEYERVGSVSSVVDSCSASGSQLQLDYCLDDSMAIEDVTII